MGCGGRWDGGSGWGTHVNPWLIHVSVWQKPLQYCKVIILQLIKINEKIFLIKKKDSFASLELPGHHYGPSLQPVHGTDVHDSLKWFPLCRRLSQSFVTIDKPAVNILALTSLCASQHYF